MNLEKSGVENTYLYNNNKKNVIGNVEIQGKKVVYGITKKKTKTK